MKPVKRTMKLSNGQERPWIEYMSEGCKEQKLPLVFCLHGGGTDGYHAFKCCGLLETAEIYPMIIVSPFIDDIPRNFDMRPESEIISLAKEFFDHICKVYQGMYNKIYIAGYSIGEMTAFQFCRKYGNRIDGFIGAVGPGPREIFVEEGGRICPPEFGIPAFLWRGSEDYSYALYKTGEKEDAVQGQVCAEYKEYWMLWNQTKSCVRTETEEYLIEKYQGEKAPLICVTAKGRGHGDEEEVLRMAWEMCGFAKET